MENKKEELSEDAVELVNGGIAMIKDPNVNLKANLHEAVQKKMKEDLKKLTKIK